MSLLRLHSDARSHSPVPATLRIHRSALEQVATILGRLWLVEGDCLTVQHQAYLGKLQKLEAAHREAAAELRDLDSACCRECQDTADEWDRFEAERPNDRLSDLDRVIRAEKEAQAERALAYEFTPDKDDAPHPFAGGSCDLAIHAANCTSFDGERRCG